MDCNVAKTKLVEYFDGELSAEERTALECHLAVCPDCGHAAELERAYREIYVLPLRPDQAPERVRVRTARLLQSLAVARGPGRQRASRPRIFLAATALGVLVAGLSVFLLWWVQPRQVSASLLRLADASVEQHQRLTRALVPYDIARISPREAEQWFRQRLDFKVSLPELSRDDLTLVGGRISHLQDLEVAALHYRVDGEDVSLFIMPPERYAELKLREFPKFKMVTRKGYDVIVWTSHGAAYSLVSEIGGRSCLVCHSPDEQIDPFSQPEGHR